MLPLFIDLPGQPCLAWTVAWLAASRQPERAVSVRVPAASTLPVPNALGWQPVGSRVLRPDAEAAESLFAFCQEKEVPMEVCGQLFIGGHPDTARLLDLFQSASRRRLNVLNLPPSGMRARYAETGFGPGVRGLLDLDAARIDLDALRSALRERAFELGVKEHAKRPSGALHVRRGKAPVRFEQTRYPLDPDSDFPCILAGLPEPGFPELTPVFSEVGGAARVVVRPAWRTWLPGRRGLVRHQKRGEAFEALLPESLQGGSAMNGQTRPIDAGPDGSPLPFECRPDGRLFGATPEPVDLFRVAARIAAAL